MEKIHFIGIDVSKNTLDISMVLDGQIISYQQVLNTEKAIEKGISLILSTHQTSIENTVFCLEHTGMYTMILLRWLSSKGAKIWLETPVKITATLGILRGKNDKIDSNRIALYAFKNYDQIQLWKAPRPTVEKLSALLTHRTRLVKAKKQLSVAIKEQELYYETGIFKTLQQFSDKPIEEIKNQIIALEKEILETIKEDEIIYRLYKILVSIDGIGMQTAAYVLVTTNEFLNITDPKKYACYSGVAPFEYSSGKSIRKRTRVSPKANKTAKTLLHLSALSAIKAKGELRDYYLRRVEEGKSKMSVLNSVRNKLIHRMFACIKDNRMFEKEYSYKKVA